MTRDALGHVHARAPPWRSPRPTPWRSAGRRTPPATRWRPTTGRSPRPRLRPHRRRPGGPILLVSSSANPFSAFFTEILRTEGLNEFSSIDISQLAADQLARQGHRAAGRGGAERGPGDRADRLRQRRGQPHRDAAGREAGRPARPDQAPARGPRDTWRSTRRSAAAGITTDTMQYHGTADGYTLNGATSVATPVHERDRGHGRPGGVAADRRHQRRAGGRVHVRPRALGGRPPARATRPGWASRATDCSRSARTSCTTAAPRLTGSTWQGRDPAGGRAAAAAGEPDPDDGPQPQAAAALLVFPALAQGRGRRHGRRSRQGRHGGALRPVSGRQPGGVLGADWTCPRFTSYISPNTPLSNAQRWAYDNRGFEVGPASEHRLRGLHARQPRADVLHAARRLAGEVLVAARPATNRTHCLVWSDWVDRAEDRAGERDAARRQLLLLAERVDRESAGLHDRLRHADALRGHERGAAQRLPGGDVDDRRVGPELPGDDQHAAGQRARHEGLLRRVHDQLPHRRRGHVRERRGDGGGAARNVPIGQRQARC